LIFLRHYHGVSQVDKKKIVIFGCGGHSRSVSDVILMNDSLTELVFVDAQAHDKEKLFEFDVVKTPPIGEYSYFIAIGDNYKRKEKYEEIGEGRLISVISNKAHIGRHSSVGNGCFIGNFCHIGPVVSIGNNTIINTGAVIEHEVTIGRHCHIGPNATISGRCSIGDLTFIGVGATVKDYVTICSDVVVGAGATVINDISEPGTYVGSPVKKVL
jgi:UDP-N-acetylbacillosamine N-acetyltransferase